MSAGVPPRIDAGVKAALLDLVDGTVCEGWSARRACAVLELDGRRREAGRLDDSCGGGVVHGVTPAERRAILELFEVWGDIDGGYRKLAHRGSYQNLIWVSPSTVYRVLAGEGLSDCAAQTQCGAGASHGGLGEMAAPPDLDL